MTRAYFDNNATTPVDPKVAQFVTEHLNVFGNPSSLHQTGRAAKELLENARNQLAIAIGAHYDQLLFTSSGSEGNNQVIQSVLFQTLLDKKPRHILLSPLEHSSIRISAQRLTQFGIDVSYFPVLPSGVIDLEALPTLLKPHTALISVMMANNETGILQPIQKLVERTQNHPCLVHTDAVQAFGKYTVDVEGLGVDFLTLSAHKTYAPKGVGVLYTKNHKQLHALIAGSSHEKELRAGTENVVFNAAFGFASTLFEPDFNQAYFLAHYKTMQNELTLLCPSAVFHSNPQIGLPNTLCVGFPGFNGQSIAMNCDLEGIDVSTGSACSSGSIEPSSVLAAMGVSDTLNTSTIRISMGRFTSDKDIQKLLVVLRSVLKA